MIIEFHKYFDKRYRKLNRKLQEKVDKAIETFIQDPFDQSLRNHPLHGSLEGKRAFWVTGDVRVIFEEHHKYTLVLMLDVGSHNQVY